MFVRIEHESNGNTNCNWCTRNGPQKLGKGTGRAGNQRTSRDHRNYTITKVGKNTEKSPEDLSRIVSIQTTVKDHLLV